MVHEFFVPSLMCDERRRPRRGAPAADSGTGLRTQKGNLGFVYLFFAKTVVVGITVSLVIYIFIILTDNVFARAKWRQTLASAWIITFVFGLANMMTLFFVLKK